MFVQASEVVQLILDNGKLRPPEIVERLSLYDPVKGPHLPCRLALPDLSSSSCAGPSLYSQAIHKLVEASYLKPSTVLSHFSPRDKRIKYEAEEKAKISGFPTAKELRQAKETAEARLKREEEEAEKVGMVRYSRHANLTQTG